MSGDAALGLVTAGALLIFVECNRPGRVLPGAFGCLLLLLGTNNLRSFSGWSDGPLWMGLAGLGLIGLMRWRLLLGVPGVLGTALLTTALGMVARGSGGALDGETAVGCGIVLGVTSSLLMMIAGRAWRAKGGHRGASAERAGGGAADVWGVD